MYRLMPFSRRTRGESFFPPGLQQFFSWPELSWQGFSVDVKETSEGYAIQADLPGVAKENIKLSLEDGYLTIGVQQNEIRSEEQENYICRERRQVSSRRSFYVGNVSPEDVQANYTDGVLHVKLPKAMDGPSQREIEIH
ncbi:MAG: Hsp20/alpha crystallin family protein [Firmicutes bacterium]|nr:Hsp20/alpha crystallin family protein [Bacillota bacterium]